MKGFAIQRFVEQGDCLMNNEWLPWKKWKPETGRVIGRPSAPLFFFQKPLPKSIIESSSCKISQNSVKNARGRSLFWLQSINLHIYRNWIVQHIFLGILKHLFQLIAVLLLFHQLLFSKFIQNYYSLLIFRYT